MKNLILRNDEWLLTKKVNLTKEEKEIISSNDETRFDIMKEINKKRYVKASTDVIETCQKIYDEYKPILKEHDKYELIDLNVCLNEDNVKGIINCRINGEHKQIRF